jgi:hypothetical protein
MCQVTGTDWLAWHNDYDRPDSRLAHRLAAVQRQIRAALDAAPPGPVKAISVCAGQGRDLLGVLASHPRRDDVTARLVELDDRIAAAARAAAARAGLQNVEIVTGDAALAGQYADLAPADLVPRICDWFEDRGFERLWLSEPEVGYGVGAHRFAGTPEPLVPSARMFTFTR